MTEIMPTFFQFINAFVYLFPLIMSFVWMIGGLIFYWRLERRFYNAPALEAYPFFSILVPCHNEESQIAATVTQLLEIDYPDYEIILIDDGSTDKTAAILRDLCQKYRPVRAVYLKENRGKGAALNIGCLAAKGEFVLTIDADSFLDPKAIKWMAWHFVTFPRVGAVTGNPRVLNRTTLLAKIQTGEYSTIIGLIKRTQRILGKVLTVSGVIAAFRRQALVSVGFWDTDMVTEDIDITWKLERHYWDIRYEPRSVCWILVPETVKGLWRQRLRWSQGGVEVLRKHWDIWGHWSQRRLWPVYLEYVLSVAWSYIFWTLVFIWVLAAISSFPVPFRVSTPIPPAWTGLMLAFACLVQFIVSLHIDHVYDQKMLRYLFWVIWYPFMYWMITSLTVIVAAPKALLKKKGTRAIWESPDRGIDSSKLIRVRRDASDKDN
jgi:biofilm PGA synthesis N-glycosyltransferase PgaC